MIYIPFYWLSPVFSSDILALWEVEFDFNSCSVIDDGTSDLDVNGNIVLRYLLEF